jgi:sulfite reductase alpha subunit-like flavoprotein
MGPGRYVTLGLIQRERSIEWAPKGGSGDQAHPPTMGQAMAFAGKQTIPSCAKRERFNHLCSLIMSERILILYGTVTGNSEYCAEKAAKQARALGFDVRLESMLDAHPEVLTEHKTALLVVSTYGDGEPPDGTEDFFEAVVTKQRLSLPELRFSVLALGDTSYDQFCKCGKDYDAALEAVGGTRFHPLVECDTDYDDPCDTWIAGVFKALAEPQQALAA